MPTITNLKAQKNPKFINIFIDNQFAFSLPLEKIYQQKLKIGLKLTQEQVEKLLKLSSYSKILDRAIKYISLRPRSEYELKTWLKIKAKLSSESLAFKRLIQKLTQLDLINDQKFTQWWINQRTTYKPRGPKLLQAELLKKGIDRQLIDDALSKLTDQTDNIKNIAIKKWKQLNSFRKQTPPNPPLRGEGSPPQRRGRQGEVNKQRIKLTNFLLRKGYTYSQIRPVIDELLNKT